MFRKTVVALALLALALTGCAATPPVVESSPSTVAAPMKPTQLPLPPVPTPDVNDTPLPFNSLWTYSDLVSVTVSPPTPFTPSKSAAGVTSSVNLLFTVKITNGSAVALHPMVTSSITAGGQAGSPVFDFGGTVKLANAPDNIILPGQSIEFQLGFSVASDQAVLLQVAPSFDYKDALFANYK